MSIQENIENDFGMFRNVAGRCGEPHSSFSIQELAAVATQLPDVRWLGRQVFMWCGNPKEDPILNVLRCLVEKPFRQN